MPGRIHAVNYVVIGVKGCCMAVMIKVLVDVMSAVRSFPCLAARLLPTAPHCDRNHQTALTTPRSACEIYVNCHASGHVPARLSDLLSHYIFFFSVLAAVLLYYQRGDLLFKRRLVH